LAILQEQQHEKYEYTRIKEEKDVIAKSARK